MARRRCPIPRPVAAARPAAGPAKARPAPGRLAENWRDCHWRTHGRRPRRWPPRHPPLAPRLGGPPAPGLPGFPGFPGGGNSGRHRAGRQVSDRDIVGIERHRAVAGERAAAGDVRAGIERDAGQRQDVADESRRRSQRRRTADPPVDIAAEAATDNGHARIAAGRQRASDIEDEYGVRIAERVERQRSGQLRRVPERIDARRQDETAEVLPGQIRRGRSGRGRVVACRQIDLRLHRGGVADVHDARRQHKARRKSGDGVAGADTETSQQRGRAGCW